MNKLLINLFIVLLIIKLSSSFEFRQVVYTNLKCEGYPNFVYSSTQCSPNGYVSLKNKTFASVGPTSEALCKDSSSTLTSEPSHLVQLNLCVQSANGINSYIYLVNENSAPITVNGFCESFTYYDNQNCNNLLVYSYQNGTCIYSSKTSQFRKLVCTKDEQFTYDCGSDSTCAQCTSSPGSSGKIPVNKCSLKEINISDTDSPNSSSKSTISSILLSTIIFIIFYI